MTSAPSLTVTVLQLDEEDGEDGRCKSFLILCFSLLEWEENVENLLSVAWPLHVC